MKQINLINEPSQTFRLQLDNNRWEITLQAINEESMTASVILNDIEILTGQIIMPNYFLIPYFYLVEGAGNFVFITENDDYPYYTNFDKNQYLIYFSQEEIDQS